MLVGNHKTSVSSHSPVIQYAWKERAYVVPMASPKGFRWKASALRGLERLGKAEVAGNPVTVVVPALYTIMPAEVLALGWLNEIDCLGTMRHRMLEATKVTGWDVFTFHTLHNLDPYYASTIAALRETWLREGNLKANHVKETLKQFGPAYQYNCIPARLVENLVFQSSLLDWLSRRAEDAPLRFHVVGTALLSALVWSRALSFENTMRWALKIGSRWDDYVTAQAEEELKRKNIDPSDANVGWTRFGRVREILEGGSVLKLGTAKEEVPAIEAPARPFWFSVTAKDEPVLIETASDLRSAMESMDLSSWSPTVPKPIPSERMDRVRAWLVSPVHPVASACHWSVYNYLLATPAASSLFLDNIAALGRLPLTAPKSEVYPSRIGHAKMKLT